MKRLGILLAAVAAALALTASAVADQSYTDPGGDAGVGTDIVGVTVRNDVNSGAMSIQVASANPIVANHAVAIFIDADRNPSTGCNGDEYFIYGGPATGVAFLTCSGGNFVPPNVRVEAGPTARRQARTGENVPRTARPGLVACRWASPRTRG